MSFLAGGRTARWILLSIALLLTLYFSRHSFQSAPDAPSGFIPSKLYEPGAIACTDNVADQSRPVSFNPKAPLFPAFKDSIKGLPSSLYDPYPEYNSRAWRKNWRGEHEPCLGPRGVEVNGNVDDTLVVHRLHKQAPASMFGSYNVTGLASDFCLDRHARYDPYGYDEGDLEGNGGRRKSNRASKVQWDKVDWGYLQGDCFLRNQHRYEPLPFANRTTTLWMPRQEDIEDVDSTVVLPDEPQKSVSYRLWKSGQGYKQRSALVLRTWESCEWTIDTMQYIRSMIMELSLHSGAEYEVIIMVEIKDTSARIFDNDASYQQTLKKAVPDEFLNNTILFDRQLLEKWYPKAGQHEAKTSPSGHMAQPLQLLSLLRPEIEHFWQIDMDVRYTGHHYHHLETISAWAKQQPRKYLWERASRYYIPHVHGNWTNFMEIVANQTLAIKPLDEGESSGNGGVWGPERTEGIEPVGPTPPTESSVNDNYEWGVGEDADMINLAPVFDPEGTSFVSKDKLEHYPEGKHTPRRATGTTSMIRLSKRLLRAMHHGQVTSGFYMPPKMYPESTALHHGLKLVVFPLPVFLDFAKSPENMNAAFNGNEGKTVLNTPPLHDGTWHRMTYWASIDEKTTYPDELYKRWLGYGNDPSERLCLPGILLHPVKGV
ncbi:MAG: hypothetical protein ASARMPRED_002960 [Alectoria sarmentosa]|nr:MAG: hypothetical protein ASARMPRED_002960 [Alectoria sarmentosa]